jgi:hypothetical protein
MYLLANQCLKTTGVSQSGFASTFVTKLNLPSQGDKAGKRQEKNKNNSKGKMEKRHRSPNETSVRSSVLIVGNSVTLLPTVPKRRRRQRFMKAIKQKQKHLCRGRTIGRMTNAEHM